MKLTSLLKKLFYFYIDGFKAMTLGKNLWILIIIKLFILFVVIKWIFFPNYLATHFTNDTQRSIYILEQLTKEI